MKKTISLFLSILLSLIFAVTSYANINLGVYEGFEPTDPINDLRNAEKERQLLTKENFTRALYYSVPIARFEQITGYYCGPASSYMVIDAWNYSVPSTSANLYFFKNGENENNCEYSGVNHVCYDTYNSPQITLANLMGTTYTGTNISNMKNVINTYINNNYYTVCNIPNTSAGSSSLSSKILSTLQDGHPLIAKVHAKLLNRYSGSAGQTFEGHFVCIYSLNSNSLSVGISDCNYYGNLGGFYTEDLDTLRTAMGFYTSYNLMW